MEFINRHWAKFGGAAGILLVLYVYIIAGHELPLLRKYAILNLAFLMLHQFEEYVLPGGFKEYFNNYIVDPMGFIRNKITDKAILFVNIVLGWGLSVIIILFLSNSIIAVVSIIGIFFVNGLIHFFVSFKLRGYNPGVVTGAVLFIPLTIYFMNKLITTGMFPNSNLFTILPLIFFGSMLIPFSVYIYREPRR